jgi:hypothetical protein
LPPGLGRLRPWATSVIVKGVQTTLLLPLLLMCTLGAASPVAHPFEDTQKRFHIGLPAGWSFAPQPGDVNGVFFRRVKNGIPANLAVRLFVFTMPIELQSFAARIAAASDQEPGFHLLQSEPAQVGGSSGLKRRFMLAINGDLHFNKLVEQRLLVVDGIHAYVVHGETLADAFAAFGDDFATLFASFAPGPAPTAPPEPEITHVRHLRRQAVVGSWVGGNHQLQLSPGGTMVLDTLSGRYRLDNGSLIFKVQGTEHVYAIGLGEAGGLQISGGIFGAGQGFVRQTPKTAP